MAELTRLERWDKRTDLPLAGVAIVFLALYSVKVLVRPQGSADKAVDIALLVVYCMFVVDYAVRLYLADPRGRWFVRHLWELPIIVLPFLRPLRLLSLAVVVSALQRAVGETTRGKVIVYTACGAVAIVYAASLAILDVEGTRPESKIHTRRRVVVGHHDGDHRRLRRPVARDPDGEVGRRRVDDRWHCPCGQRDGNAGIVDRAARGHGGRRRGGGDAGADRGTPRGDPATREVGVRRPQARLW